MAKSLPKTSLVNISVEEENLASIPFAVLERRVGKQIGKLELKGTKTLPDGTKAEVLWQVQGNNELGLPTELDLDIFVALGVLTFQNNLSKTVSFTGREIAKQLGMSTVHGKFYQRLKLAMDRFIPLRFRALTSTDRHEDIKWLNIFQEASFTLDRTTGRCSGSVTWTDKIIHSMDAGLFRLLDAGRYCDLDGITAKHMYRFLAMAFEKTDLVVVDARKLATEHLGVVNVPQYLSRLMQTLEPAFEQLIRIEVLGAFHVVCAANWELALRRHASYVPYGKMLLSEAAQPSPELRRMQISKRLEKTGLHPKIWESALESASLPAEFYALQRIAATMEILREQGVLPQVAGSVLRNILEGSPSQEGEGRELLDWCEIALDICREKQQSGQKLKNPAGFVIKLVKDPVARTRLVSAARLETFQKRFRERERAAERQEQEILQRSRILDYEAHCHTLSQRIWQDLSEEQRQALRKSTRDALQAQGRLERLPAAAREQEIEEAILAELGRKEAPSFERWEIRQSVQQAVLPFAEAAQERDFIVPG